MSAPKRVYKKKPVAKRVYKKSYAKKVYTPNQNRAIARTQGIHLSGCAQEYLESLLFPFDARPSCIPSSFPLASNKVKVITRDTFALGTSGFGFVVVRGLTGQTAVGQKTKASSAGTALTVLSAFTGVDPINQVNSPYSAAQFAANSVEARIVSIGLRVRYTGRDDSINGTCVILEDPDHVDLLAKTFTAAASPDDAIRVPVGKQWIQCNYSGPVFSTDTEYRSVENPLGTNYFLGALITGTASDTFEVEIVTNYEAIGNIVHDKTASHSDMQAYGNIQAAVKAATNNSPLTPSDAPSVLTKVAHAIVDNAPALGNMLMEGGKQLLSALQLDPGTLLQQAVQGFTSRSAPRLIESASVGYGAMVPYSSGMSMGGGSNVWNSIFG